MRPRKKNTVIYDSSLCTPERKTCETISSFKEEMRVEALPCKDSFGILYTCVEKPHCGKTPDRHSYQHKPITRIPPGDMAIGTYPAS